MMDTSLNRRGQMLMTLCVMGCLWGWPSAGWALTAKVAGVNSGSQIAVFDGWKVETIELYGIYAPAPKEVGHKPPKQFTTERIFGKVVDLEFVKREGEALRHALVRVDGALFNEELLKEGMARVHPLLCRRPVCERWKAIEAEARSSSRGLWANPEAIPPWEGVGKRKGKKR